MPIHRTPIPQEIKSRMRQFLEKRELTDEHLAEIRRFYTMPRNATDKHIRDVFFTVMEQCIDNKAATFQRNFLSFMVSHGIGFEREEKDRLTASAGLTKTSLTRGASGLRGWIATAIQREMHAPR